VDVIKMDLKDMGWIDLAQVGSSGGFLNTIMKPFGSINTRNFPTSFMTLSLSKRTLLRRIS